MKILKTLLKIFVPVIFICAIVTFSIVWFDTLPIKSSIKAKGIISTQEEINEYLQKIDLEGNFSYQFNLKNKTVTNSSSSYYNQNTEIKGFINYSDNKLKSLSYSAKSKQKGKTISVYGKEKNLSKVKEEGVFVYNENTDYFFINSKAKEKVLASSYKNVSSSTQKTVDKDNSYFSELINFIYYDSLKLIINNFIVNGDCYKDGEDLYIIVSSQDYHQAIKIECENQKIKKINLEIIQNNLKTTLTITVGKEKVVNEPKDKTEYDGYKTEENL